MKAIPGSVWWCAGALTLAVLAGCGSRAEPYAPGLGEIMTLTQMRHAKLWFAGAAKNWPLAAYELEELREGLDDAVKLHPTHKDAPVARLVPRFMDAPLAGLEAAVEKHDSGAFDAAFDALSAGCNGCHVEARFGFNVVTRPSGNTYTNQQFAPATP